MSSLYREKAVVPPELELRPSWRCRLGLHAWNAWPGPFRYEYVATCTRPRCDKRRYRFVGDGFFTASNGGWLLLLVTAALIGGAIALYLQGPH